MLFCLCKVYESSRKSVLLTFFAYFPFLVRKSLPLSPFSYSLPHFGQGESPPLSLFPYIFPHFGQRESSSFTFFLLTSLFWSERALLSHLSSCSLPHFGQREPSSLTFFLLTSSFWSERVLLSHLFLAHFLILVRESPPLSPFSYSLPPFGQRESSSLTFLLHISSFWSERALLSHLFLAYFLILIWRTLFGLSSCKGMSEKGKSIEIRKLKMLIYQHS